MQHPGRLRTILLSLLGLGYLHVGRWRTYLMVLIAPLLALALLGRSGLLFEPGVLIPVAVMLVLYQLTVWIHPSVIVWRAPAVQRRGFNRWWVYLLALAATSALYEGVKHARGSLLGAQTYRISASSMAPTLETGDVILVDSRRGDRRQPGVGDIIVFRTERGTPYVKRLVGLPGDTISIRDRVVYRNGDALDEPYLAPADPQYRRPRRQVGELVLGPGQYYVLGDNRDHSEDSRYFGPIDETAMLGTVRLKLLRFGPEGVSVEGAPQRLDRR